MELGTYLYSKPITKSGKRLPRQAYRAVLPSELPRSLGKRRNTKKKKKENEQEEKTKTAITTNQ